MTCIRTYLLLLMICMMFCFMTISCVSDSEERVPDVSRIEVDAEIIRVDSMLNSVQSISDLSELEHQLSTFYELYFRRILRLPNAMNQDFSLEPCAIDEEEHHFCQNSGTRVKGVCRHI